MASLNKVLLMGNLTRDPETKYVASGNAMTRFGLALNRSYKGTDGEKKEEVCFINVTAWARTGEIAQEFLSKGSPVFIEGRLRYYQLEGEDGQKRSGVEVVAENLQLLPRNGESEATTSASEGEAYQNEIPF